MGCVLFCALTNLKLKLCEFLNGVFFFCSLQLPRCLCLHIQRTVWLNNGLPIKRFDTVSFPELLNMGPYIYQKESPVLRPKTLELDGNARLVGGRKRLTEETKPLVVKSIV